MEERIPARCRGALSDAAVSLLPILERIKAMARRVRTCAG